MTTHQCLNGEMIDLAALNVAHNQMVASLWDQAAVSESWVAFQNQTARGVIEAAKVKYGEMWSQDPLYQLQLDLVGRIGVARGELRETETGSGKHLQWSKNLACPVTYRRGDATAPVGNGYKLITHITNDRNGWGAGFVVALSKRWPQPEAEYRKSNAKLGYVSWPVVVGDNLAVVNMCAQKGYSSPGKPAIDYGVLETCLRKLRGIVEATRYETGLDVSVHCPRIGCGLAGGQWGEVEELVQEQLATRGVSVTVYDL